MIISPRFNYLSLQTRSCRYNNSNITLIVIAQVKMCDSSAVASRDQASPLLVKATLITREGGGGRKWMALIPPTENLLTLSAVADV